MVAGHIDDPVVPVFARQVALQLAQQQVRLHGLAHVVFIFDREAPHVRNRRGVVRRGEREEHVWVGADRCDVDGRGQMDVPLLLEDVQDVVAHRHGQQGEGTWHVSRQQVHELLFGDFAPFRMLPYMVLEVHVVEQPEHHSDSEHPHVLCAALQQTTHQTKHLKGSIVGFLIFRPTAGRHTTICVLFLLCVWLYRRPLASAVAAAAMVMFVGGAGAGVWVWMSQGEGERRRRVRLWGSVARGC
mmetsp:Transcript_22699/g.64911  ORF Transcript_22699/g.64911 Transcript_22699/m.64911 type:complete len:243 (-) Transcript_22699:866-1594(-)